MVRQHARTRAVRTAASELEVHLWNVMQEHDLTYLEAMRIMNDAQANLIKYALRTERHPTNPTKPADEA